MAFTAIKYKSNSHFCDLKTDLSPRPSLESGKHTATLMLKTGRPHIKGIPNPPPSIPNERKKLSLGKISKVTISKDVTL